MNKRERMLRAIEFGHPDRLPVLYHSSPAGLWVHGKKLLELFEKYPCDNYMPPWELPQIPAGCFDSAGNYEEYKIDSWGVKKRYRIVGLHGFTVEYPLADYEHPKPWHFPPLAGDDPVLFKKLTEKNQELRREYLLSGGGISLFEIPCSLRPMDDVLVDIVTEESAFLELLDSLTEYYLRLIDMHASAGYDVMGIGDDWGIQTGPIISPESFKRIFKPRYKKLIDQIHTRGMKVQFHSCGNVGRIFNEIADLGIDIYWHQMNRYDEKKFIPFCRDTHICVYIHPDRQHLIPQGSPEEIENTIKRYADIYHKLGGGAIFYIEIENDAPFENVSCLVESVHRYA